MPETLHNTPFCLIPKELFKKEQIHEYWDLLYPAPQPENFSIDELENFFFIYFKSKDEETVHETYLIYNNLREKLPNQENIIFVNLLDEKIYLLVIKDHTLAFAGYFNYTVKEDVLYHLTNISQQYFENILQVDFRYQQLSSSVLRLLNNYYEMKSL
jgi:hypothetical protein